ncbi:MAG: preprotein translocase subunit SecY [Vampirovibrionales bacterium]|nr:preprotein translocase subunit SecY [Vampirovibrionales bacterium]
MSRNVVPMMPKASAKSAIPSMSDLAFAVQSSGLVEKIGFTILCIAIYRLGVQIPLWGIDPASMQGFLKGGLGSFLDLFSGGALGRLSVLALGIGPYITASIMLQLLTVAIPRLEEMQKEEGEAGRKKIAQYTRYVTVALAVFQATLIVRLVAQPINLLPGVEMTWFWVSGVISLVAGSLFALWLAEMMTERGIGNGGSLLILVGILASLPVYVEQTATLISGDPSRAIGLVALLAVFVVLIGLIIILQEASRNVYVVSAKRQVGQKMFGGQGTHIPFKINPAGVMPIIFAFAVMAFPDTIFRFAHPQPDTFLYTVQTLYNQYFGYKGMLYGCMMFVLVIFFTFFYASIIPSMNPREIADNLKKQGAAIPGIKPGRPTAEKLDEILTRIVWIGAISIASITLLTSYAPAVFRIPTLAGIGTTSLIILVGVALDTINQIRVHLLARQYQGFLK